MSERLPSAMEQVNQSESRLRRVGRVFMSLLEDYGNAIILRGGDSYGHLAYIARPELDAINNQEENQL